MFLLKVYSSFPQEFLIEFRFNTNGLFLQELERIRYIFFAKLTGFDARFYLIEGD